MRYGYIRVSSKSQEQNTSLQAQRDAVTAAGVDVQKSEVLMPHGTIRDVGEYEVELQLHADVTAAITLVVKGAA